MIHISLIMSCFFSLICVSATSFTSDSLTLEFPSTIVASGNAIFNHEMMTINSDRFTYDTSSQSGSFESNVIIQYKQSTLKGTHFNLNLVTRSVDGHGNIEFEASDFSAYSNDLRIDEFEILTLKNDVFIQRNGSQIKSNELIYNLKTDTILSNERVKLRIE